MNGCKWINSVETGAEGRTKRKGKSEIGRWFYLLLFLWSVLYTYK